MTTARSKLATVSSILSDSLHASEGEYPTVVLPVEGAARNEGASLHCTDSANDLAVHTVFMMARAEVPAKAQSRSTDVPRRQVQGCWRRRRIARSFTSSRAAQRGHESDTRGRHLPCRVPSQLELKHASNSH